MKVETQTLGKRNDGKVAVIEKKVTESYSAQELDMRVAGLRQQQQSILRQMEQLKGQYDTIGMEIGELEEVKQGFTSEMPEVMK